MSEGQQDGLWLQEKGHLATIHKQDAFVKIPEHRSQAEAPLWTTKTEKNYIRMISRADSLWLHLHFPRQAECCTNGAPGPAVTPMGKGEPKVDIQILSIPDAFRESHCHFASWRSLEGRAKHGEEGWAS